MRAYNYLFGLMVLVFSVSPAAAETKRDPITITRDADKLVTHITIEARKGQIAWADVLAGLARAKGYDDTALAGLMPDSSFPIDGAYSGWAVFGWNRVLPRGIRLRREVEPGAEPRLTISLDRAALLASKRRLQKLFRESTTRTVSFFGLAKPRDYGIRLDKDWQKTPVDKPIVLLVPGFQASHDSMEATAKQLQKLGYLTATCSYPNDQPIDDSARLLANALKRIAEQQPKRQVRLVAYSMGGLVARRVIEDPELDPGNVKQLVMVAVPNQGSRLACLGFAVELWEHGFESKEGNMFRRFYASIEDGLGEADEDLSPESIFLRDLNARPRNPKVAYSILLGSGGFLTRDAVNLLREQLKKDARENRLLQFLRPKLDRWLADLDEVIADKGDGAVALSRGKLAGVDDVVTLDINHLSINRDPQTAGERRLLEEIGKRLNRRLR
jgi:pimeloyl-ACP methyl ester carboxylesterase